ncbi:hypothetical protein [Salinilacihabitans rarus]|uniref:hypothetical protein n=1 Tax=Salinilacihabitans rarus TaxID=2961596 RepID=UPI0020C8A20A|nr:hypothetical protein [Salinilacihabitans rarus]
MRTIPVELDDETVEALDVERRLLGFESRRAYLRWIVANRAAIDGDAARVEQSARDRPADPEGTAADEDGREDADRATAATDDAATGAEKRTDADGGWTRPKSDPTVRVRGSPQTTVWRASEGESPEAADAGDDGERPADATSTDADAVDEAGGRDAPDGTGDGADGVSSMHLAPERVDRISEDPVAEDAGVLGTVEVDRLDELSRRAVAKTRKRLNRDVQTGLTYDSSTRLSSDVRPGEDVVDLESLSVPGRSAEVVERRREAAGRAVAYLRDVGRARKSDFVEALYEECPAGYETSDGWWRCVKEALRQVDAVDGGDGARVWRFES